MPDYPVEIKDIGDDEWVDFTVDKKSVCLDGNFTKVQLKRIVDCMEEV